MNPRISVAGGYIHRITTTIIVYFNQHHENNLDKLLGDKKTIENSITDTSYHLRVSIEPTYLEKFREGSKILVLLLESREGKFLMSYQYT